MGFDSIFFKRWKKMEKDGKRWKKMEKIEMISYKISKLTKHLLQ
jgi:hypothetical protein